MVPSPLSGYAGIGTNVSIVMGAGEAGLVVGSNGCSVNGVGIGSRLSFTSVGSVYTLLYTVAEGDNYVSAGALTFSCELADASGNKVGILQ